jgi:hypothetical protein
MGSVTAGPAVGLEGREADRGMIDVSDMPPLLIPA